MRGIGQSAAGAFAAALAVAAAALVVEQLRDSTSSLRLRLAELADRLREVTP